jgi:hypothetical protein
MVDPAGDWMGFARTRNREKTTQRFASEYLGNNIFVGVSPFSSVQIPMDDLVGKDAEGKPLPGVHIGSGAAMFGVDYPQFESIFDRTMGAVATLVSTPGVTDDDVRRILLENAARVYRFDISALQPHIDQAGFDLTEVRANAEELKNKMPKETRAPLMGSAAARATASA